MRPLKLGSAVALGSPWNPGVTMGQSLGLDNAKVCPSEWAGSPECPVKCALSASMTD